MCGITQQVAHNVILAAQFTCWPGFDNKKQTRGRRVWVSYPFQLRNGRVIWSVRVSTLSGKLRQSNFRMKLQKVKFITASYNPTLDNCINKTLRCTVEQSK